MCNISGSSDAKHRFFPTAGNVFRCACSENTVIFHLIGILKKVKRDGQMLFASVVKGNIRLFTSSFLMFVK